MDRAAIVARVRKLLNLAEDGGAAEQEIESALRFANQLMDEHAISMGELSEQDTKDLEMDRMWVAGSSAKTVMWEAVLGVVVGKALKTVQCYRDTTVRMPRDPGTGLALREDGQVVTEPRKGIQFYGPAADVSLAITMYHELRLTIATMARLKFGSVTRGAGRSYCEGFVVGLDSYLRDLERDRPVETRAIVLRNTQAIKAQAKDWLEETHGVRLGKVARSSGSFHGDAYREGATDGRSHGIRTRSRPTLSGG